MPRHTPKRLRPSLHSNPPHRRRLTGGEELETRHLLTAGSLDLTLGGTGFASSHPGVLAGDVTAGSMAITSSGQIVQVGEAVDPTTHNTDIAVVEYNAGGTLNANFGSGGIVLTPISTGAATPAANQVLIDSQGRIVVVGGDGTNFELLRYTSAGVLDSTFGTGGKVSTPIPGSGSGGVATRAAFDAAGDIIVGGSAFSSQLGTYAPVFRYQPNGALDPTFGLNGMAVGDFPTVSINGITTLLVEQDGSIVLGGNDSGNTADWALLRLTSAGRPDPTFGTFGAVITSFGNTSEGAFGLAEQADGKILAVGSASASSAGKFDVARYNLDGSLDATFGTGGTLSTSFAGDHANALDVAVDPNGKIVVGGSVTVTGQTGTYFAAARYLTDGTLDPTFGSGGQMTTVGAAQNDESAFNVSMALDSSGKIALASSGANYNVARLTGDPAVPGVSSLFSADQSVQASASGTVPLVFTVQLSAASAQQVTVNYSTADGTALAGTDYSTASGQLTFMPGVTSQQVTVQVKPNNATEPNKSFVLNLTSPAGAPLLNDQYSGVILSSLPPASSLGDLDSSFGWGGFAEDHPYPAGLTEQVDTIGVQSDGKIVEGGYLPSGAPGAPAGEVIRFNSDGTLDSTFGGSGTVDVPFTVTVLTVLPNDDILVGGSTGRQFDVERLLPNGLSDPTFGSGIVNAPATNFNWAVSSMSTDPQGDIFLAGFKQPMGGGAYTPATPVVVMINANGTANTSFGQNGTVTMPAQFEDVSSMLVDGSGNLVIDGSDGTSTLLIRLDSSGVLDTSFGQSGMVTEPAGLSAAYLTQSGGNLIAVGDDPVSGQRQTADNIAVIEYTSTGSINASFGNQGIATIFQPGYFDALNNPVEVLPDGKILVFGGVYQLSNFTWKLAVARFNPDGTPDTTFGNQGSVTTSYTFGSVYAAAVTPNGDIAISIHGSYVPGGAADDYAVAEFHADTAEVVSAPPAALHAVAGTPTSMVFNVTLNEPSATPVTVQYATANGTALAGTDYTAASGNVTFAPGVTSQPVTVTVLGNLYADPSKTFSLKLSNPVGAFLSPSTTTAQLINSDTAAWTDPVNPLDVDGDGLVTPADALAIINYLNSKSPTALGMAPIGVHNFLDTDGDQQCTPADALKVINALNAVAKPATAAQGLELASPAVSSDPKPIAVTSLVALTSSAAVTGSIGDIAFGLAAAGQSPAAPRGPAVIATPAAAANSTVNQSVSLASSGPLAGAAQTLRASSLRDNDFDAKTDVEDLLGLLVGP